MKRQAGLLVVAAAILAPLVAYGLLADQAQLVHFFPDDAFYYLKPAQNFVRTSVPSFDGLHPTNGFHPLYFLVAAALASATSPPGLVESAFLLSAVLIVAAVGLATACSGLRPGWAACALLAALSTPPVVGLIVLSAGLEASTVLLVTVLLVVAFERAVDRGLQSRRWNLMLAATMTLLQFARLDLVIVLTPFVVVLAWVALVAHTTDEFPSPARGRGAGGEGALNGATGAELPSPGDFVATLSRGERVGGAAAMGRVGRLLAVLAIPGVLGAAYLALNYAWMGHIVPISGYVKHLHWIPLSVSWRAATGGGPLGLLIGLIPLLTSLAVIPWAVRRLRATERPGGAGDWPVPGAEHGQDAHATQAGPGRAAALMALNLGNVLFYVYLLGFASNFFRWYLALPLACLILNVVFLMAISERVARWLSRASRGWALALTVLAVAGNVAANAAFLRWAGRRENTTSYQLYRVARLVIRYGGPNAVTGTLDAGVIGYYATGMVVNLDGLANDFDYYANYRLPGRMLEYFRKTGMTHLLVRDHLIENLDQVQQGDYQTARFRLDPRVSLPKRNELFRYTLPGSFSVYYFALEPCP